MFVSGFSDRIMYVKMWSICDRMYKLVREEDGCFEGFSGERIGELV